MECRCYQGGQGRTRLRQLKYGSNDAVTMVLFIAITVAVGVLGRFGL
jgi:energy-coupling factor transport system permease protein